MRGALGVNQAVWFTDRTFLFMNDFIGFFGIESIIPEIRYIFMPDFPHSTDVKSYNASTANPNKDYRFVARHITKLGFSGRFYIYQLQTTYNAHGQRVFLSESSTDIPIALLSERFNFTSIHTYGYRRGEGYHPFMSGIIGQIDSSVYADDETKSLVDAYKANLAQKPLVYLQPDEVGVIGSWLGTRSTRYQLHCALNVMVFKRTLAAPSSRNSIRVTIFGQFSSACMVDGTGVA